MRIQQTNKLSLNFSEIIHSFEYRFVDIYLKYQTNLQNLLIPSMIYSSRYYVVIKRNKERNLTLL